jgi:hypothetical protein
LLFIKFTFAGHAESLFQKTSIREHKDFLEVVKS